MNQHLTANELDRRNRAIVHVVHDYCNLVSSGKLTKESHQSPINHHIQHAFLLECRKFYDFFMNNRGDRSRDIVAKDYLSKKLKVNVPTWRQWRDHMSAQLIHLSYLRVDNTVAWAGYSVNDQLLREFMCVWSRFLESLDNRFRAQFKAEFTNQSAKPEYARFFS